jgi:transposase
VLTAIDENTPVAVEVLPGQVHEATQVEKMLDASQARLPQIEEAVADKGFDGEPQRQAMASRNIRPVIPYRVNRRNRGRVTHHRSSILGQQLRQQTAGVGLHPHISTAVEFLLICSPHRLVALDCTCRCGSLFLQEVFPTHEVRLQPLAFLDVIQIDVP